MNHLLWRTPRHCARGHRCRHVQVHAERHPANPLVVKVTEAQFTYVAINDDDSKREVPVAL